ncbi:MAG: hypothetical protein IPL40_00580 [Proteobacteria bacterium]|nr:hypothetical protein [Pseudomonadota bacterium]
MPAVLRPLASWLVLVALAGCSARRGAAPDEACKRGDTQPVPGADCGLNGRGTLERTCEVGGWSEATACVDPDLCVDGATQAGEAGEAGCGFGDLGRLVQLCQAGRWSDSDQCVSASCTEHVDCGVGRCLGGSCGCPALEGITPDAAWSRAPTGLLLTPGQSHPDGSTSYLIADPSLRFDAEARSWRLWFSGLRGSSFSGADQTVIEYAESADGLSWVVADAPALVEAAEGWDSLAVETPDVLVDPAAAPARRYLMVYSGAKEHLAAGYRDYQLGLALSADGTRFSRLSAAASPYGLAGLVLTAGDAFPSLPSVNGGVVADPVLALKDGVFHLWFSSLGCSDGNVCEPSKIVAFGIGHATSADATHWTMDAGNPVLKGGQQPSVSWDPHDCVFELWYSYKDGSEGDTIPSDFNAVKGFRHAISADGSSWSEASANDFAWDIDEPGEELGLLTGVAVVRVGRALQLYYVGLGTTGIPSAEFHLPVNRWYDGAGFVPGTFGLKRATRLPSEPARR